MLTLLLGEAHFWTMRDEVRIRNNDYGAFRYQRQREVQQASSVPIQELTQALAKRDYTERRNGVAVLKSGRKSVVRLKENLKKFEELLRTHKIVHCEWQDAAQVLLLFANGVIVHICVDIYTGDILRMVFEKYLVGKLASELITDAFFTRSHIVLAYNTNQLTVVQLQKPNVRPLGPEKISNMEPRIFHVIIPGTAERKLARHLTVNSSYDLFVVWTQSSQNEVYPWRPTIRDQDRANIHVFKINGMQLESMAYCWSEHDPLSVDFLRSSESQIITLEQKVSRKGDISAEICSYEVQTGKMQRTAITSIAMGTQICCFAFSPDQEKLLLGAIDRSLCLHDLVQQTSNYVAPIEIIPTHCTWHSDSALVVVANERSQFQCFDLALAAVGCQLLNEEDFVVTPSMVMELSHYFTQPPTLLSVAFSRKPDLGNFSHKYAQTDCFLLLLYEHGPLASLRLFAGAGMRGDIHNSGLTADVIADQYLHMNQLERAVGVLGALNWETYGAMCLITLHKIANYVFFRASAAAAAATTEGHRAASRIELMARALRTFADSLSEETKDEFSDQVFDLKRRFCFYLMRRNLFAEAFEVAQDTEDYDLFMDLYNLTKNRKSHGEFAKAAFAQAAAILKDEADASPDSDGGSQSSGGSELPATQQQQPKPPLPAPQQVVKSYVPPLPSFKSKVFNAEMIKINIPKPELRIPPPPLPKLDTTAPSSSSSLAMLSLKSGMTMTTGTAAPPQPPAPLPLPLPPPPTWSQDVPDQTVGLPLPLPIVRVQSPPPPPLPIANATPTTPIGGAAAAAYQPKFYQHPLVSGHIPAVLPAIPSEEHQKRLLLKKPTASILSNSNSNAVAPSTAEATAVKSAPVEKNKVKFSDTVQVAVVPEIPRKEKPMPPKRNGYSRPASRHLTNPRKELADSLPLCHPNDEYLKDFNPITTNVNRPPTRRRHDEQGKNKSNNTATTSSSSSSSIKVVHFGVV